MTIERVNSSAGKRKSARPPALALYEHHADTESDRPDEVQVEDRTPIAEPVVQDIGGVKDLSRASPEPVSRW